MGSLGEEGREGFKREGSGKIFGRNALRVGSRRGMQTFVNH